MENLPKLHIEDYNYDLPAERIAQYPIEVRDQSKLLIYKNGRIAKDTFNNIYRYLPSDSLLVFNNTKVISARLLFRKETGANIEVFCLEPVSPGEYEQSFSSKSPVEWKCIIGNLKKWKKGSLTANFSIRGRQYVLSAEKIKPDGDAYIISFSWNSNTLSFGEVIGAAGHIPLPPYIKREDEEADKIRYQTVYSSVNGSVAAPTAGLHFTKSVLEHINNKGIRCAELTLHVGAGTFQPVKTNKISKHEMHCEHFVVNEEVIENIIRFKGKIIAVGTTSVRTLESLYWLGAKIINNPSSADSELIISQWEPFQSDRQVKFQESLEALLKLLRKRKTSILHASTKIMIIPGYEFRTIRGMITNFHQPRSTLLLLLAAWTGNDWKRIYGFALENDFRFLSYGDCSLLLK